MITNWAPIAEPVPSTSFAVPFYATDIQILVVGKGVVMATPDGTKLYRVYVDFDGDVATEFVAAFNGIPATTPPPFGSPTPVFGQVAGDVMILAAGAGVLFPAGPVSITPRQFYRLRLDNDGTVGTEPVTTGYWMQILENNVPIALDVNQNWVFTGDIQFVSPGIGMVLPLRGGSGNRRIRIDFDGTIISE